MVEASTAAYARKPGPRCRRSFRFGGYQEPVQVGLHLDQPQAAVSDRRFALRLARIWHGPAWQAGRS
jgi:hypothetical protein